MQITDTVIASIVGAIAGVITSLLASWIGYRTLRTEFLAKHRLELISKQIAACEALWIVLEPVSRSVGENRVIKARGNKHYVDVQAAKELCAKLTLVFNSLSGLYYSRFLRKALFDLRDFIEKEFLANAQEGQTELEVSNTKANNFLDGEVQNLRIALRKEIGTEDLSVAKEGPVKGL
jgi:hypothetical protein